ncbi:MAG TPA: amino acid permease [Solirubrobacteraceae bacterium]|jgi:urea carboxylase system permease|nr:amino acid permease [Solirubrobacteraceae bacterium]
MTNSATATADADARDLAGFGYPQVLRRGLGGYASFAAGFSFVSILTTVFQLFAFGFSFGGAAFFWTWPIVFAGQMMVALCFAELASRYPISGCIYQWSRRLSNATFGWFAGWVMLVGQIITISAAAIALQVVMPSIWSGFQIVGGNPSLATSSGASNAVLLGSILITATTIINVLGVRLMARINSIGVTCELIGVTLLIIMLFAHSRRGPEAVLHRTGAPSGGYLGLFIVSALMAAYVMVGFDSAGELSEETRDPRRTAPKSILRALAVSGLGGGVLLIAAICAAPSLTDGTLGTQGLPYVLTSRLGTTVGRIFLCDVTVAICVCTLAIHTAATRMMFSMSRDRVLPFGRVLAAVSPRTGTPILPAVVIGILAALILVVNLGQAALFTDLTSECIVMLYGAYLMVTAPMLVRRLRGTLRAAEPGMFSLGRWGPIVNGLAVGYGAAMMINLAWPRTSVYDPAGGHFYLHFFSLLFIAGTLVVGVLAFVRHRYEQQVEPAAEPAAPELAAAGVQG